MRRGLTLIEVLVALAIASVVFASVFLLYRTSATVAWRQSTRESTVYAPAAALQSLREDLRAMLPARLDPSNRLQIITRTTSSGGLATEASWQAWQMNATNQPYWHDVIGVRWQVWGADTPTATLARTTWNPYGPPPASGATNLLLGRVRSFQLVVYDGTNWLANWPPKDVDEKTPEPLTVRVTLSYGDEPRTVTADVLLPSGLVFTSSVPRQSALAPGGAQGR